ncbi:MAE_28990/MAE_18760 family HEPN-like nuclease [Sphingobium sp. D43FB]|uniref:MAE_28990/MAE_18760 family HEPN-like nuclease n=1 Tax=Sphingobium sp. D43FB TaxID=2017595 RepID=UPI000BB54FDF|nr:MAE_28990/MAE_18760 family HEPN-like nuclease [Sphingobium sp. D43FB]PBN44956.1 hypothetical protein SxD43FB_01790 [Sphingobium sp. D43FB]
MHSAILERTLNGFKAIRRHVAFSANLRAQVGATDFECASGNAKCSNVRRIMGEASDPTSWRVIDHCAAVTRSYALFESFVIEVLREYLAFLAGAYKMSALGPDFGVRYTKGIGKILQDQQKQRYRNLDIAAMITGVSEALGDLDGYQIQPEALLRTEQNLRMAELQRLFNDCGLSGVESWVGSHAAIQKFFAEQARLSDTATSELKQIVDYRNEAAHGEVDDVLGHDILIEFTHFFDAMCRCLLDVIQYDTIRRAKELNRATVVGRISETFRDDIVVAKVENATLTVGDKLYVFKKGLTLIAEVGSIRINDEDVETVTAVEETEVGLRLGIRAKVGCELLRLQLD